jgi:hypothetical protein
MNGRVIAIEYANGWGRVELDDGRILTFDTAACRAGIPERDAVVSVELVASRLGGEKVGALRVAEAWEALPAEVPFFVTARDLLVVRGGVAAQAPSCPEPVRAPLAPGDTGYATIEVRRGVVGHSTAWAGSTYGGPAARDERVRSLRSAPLRAEEIEAFKPAIARELLDLLEDVDDPDAQESTLHEDDLRDVQVALAIAARLGIDTRRRA